MNETRLRTIEHLQQFLSATPEVTFTAPPAGSLADNQRYEHISRVLARFDYPQRNKRERGVALAYLRRTSGYRRAQLTRLVTRWADNRVAQDPLVKRYRAPAAPFPCKYTILGALYDFVAALKARHLRQSEPLSKAVFDGKLHIVRNALGTHTTVSRVQGTRLKAKREIRVASLFKDAPAAGCLRSAQGTLTQLSILTMPADDIGHPIPDLTGYITEGQIVLSRELDRRGVYPPVNVLPSLSRLMKDGTGGKYTHPDHPALASQLYAAYARAAQARVLASVVGEEGLAETDRKYLRFGTAFEQTLVSQTEARTLEQSMALGWSLLAGLPKSELTRLSDAQIAAHIEGAA